jgi:hypothetical protein
LKHGTVRVMAAKAGRRAARERVSAYHESQLAGLLGHVGAEIDRYRGELDAYAADETIHDYHRAAAELWKFCFARGGGAHVEFIAGGSALDVRFQTAQHSLPVLAELRGLLLAVTAVLR